MTTASIPNPLPMFSDDFVSAWKRGDRLFVKCVLPKPEELANFGFEAERAGFRPGREVCWGGSRWAPEHWFRDE